MRTLLAGLAIALLPAIAVAQPFDPDRWTDVHGWDRWWDGRSRPIVGPTDAVDVPALTDGAWIQLRGRIVGGVGDDDLLFVDDTGAVVLDIDSPVWWGRDFRPGRTVEVSGEVDHNLDGVEVDVSSIQAVG